MCVCVCLMVNDFTSKVGVCMCFIFGGLLSFKKGSLVLAVINVVFGFFLFILNYVCLYGEKRIKIAYCWIISSETKSRASAFVIVLT